MVESLKVKQDTHAFRNLEGLSLTSPVSTI